MEAGWRKPNEDEHKILGQYFALGIRYMKYIIMFLRILVCILLFVLIVSMFSGGMPGILEMAVYVLCGTGLVALIIYLPKIVNKFLFIEDMNIMDDDIMIQDCIIIEKIFNPTKAPKHMLRVKSISDDISSEVLVKCHESTFYVVSEGDECLVVKIDTGDKFRLIGFRKDLSDVEFLTKRYN